MQNIALPDKAEQDVARREVGYYVETTPGEELDAALAMVWALEAWVRALYAKRGEDCPLFKDGG